MTRSIVTGAAGFVGSHVADRLLSLGHDVVGIDCFTDYYARRLKERNIAQALGHERFTLVESDLSSADLDGALEGADYVFHIAGQAGVRPSWGEHFSDYIQCNVAATQRLLEAAKDAGLKRFVFASSSSVYGNAQSLPVNEQALPQPVSPYGVTKLAAEHLCALYAYNYGLPSVSLRLFTVYGPRQRPEMAIQAFLSAAKRGEPVTVFGDGEQTRDFTFVGDVVQAHILAMDSEDPGPFNVCGGSRVTLNELLRMIRDTTGSPLEVTHEEAARGDALHTLGDNTRARAALGFQPTTTLAQGVEAQWRWLGETANES
ncbi:MAG: NAD-dependent epimerase/dehydratase family protein [Dehalococcoidia bacterium]